MTEEKAIIFCHLYLLYYEQMMNVCQSVRDQDSDKKTKTEID